MSCRSFESIIIDENSTNNSGIFLNRWLHISRDCSEVRKMHFDLVPTIIVTVPGVLRAPIGNPKKFILNGSKLLSYKEGPVSKSKWIKQYHSIKSNGQAESREKPRPVDSSDQSFRRWLSKNMLLSYAKHAFASGNNYRTSKSVAAPGRRHSLFFPAALGIYAS